jgi:hypothetical protein
VSQPLPKFVGNRPGALRDDALVTDHRREKGEGVGMQKSIRLVIVREANRSPTKGRSQCPSVSEKRIDDRRPIGWRCWHRPWCC